ncbi:hypothetical protein DdX_02173 [Ditylenchus destructor]|uniref:Uncharacterized protein n=1 Tax=Ditylenchus destructor TaxID=166010 RepID=A0AAD4NC11_9BILA|nr:hypothetical protein DdX_02173 [Ditylenchus destructor]
MEETISSHQTGCKHELLYWDSSWIFPSPVFPCIRCAPSRSSLQWSHAPTYTNFHSRAPINWTLLDLTPIPLSLPFLSGTPSWSQLLQFIIANEVYIHMILFSLYDRVLFYYTM